MPALPGPSRWRAPLPGTSTSTSPLPAASRIRLPAGQYEPPPYTEINLTGHGLLVLAGAPAAAADLAGAGVIAFGTTVETALNFSARAFLTFGQEAEFNLTGTGDLDFAAAPNLTTAYAGTGVLTMTASAGTTLDLSGSGALTAAAAGGTSLALVGQGSLSATADGEEWFLPSGMTKNGTQTWANSSAWVTITNWTANTGTYPGSTVDASHRLVVQGAKTNATVSAQVTYGSGFFNRGHSIRLIDQSTPTPNVLATSTANTANSGTVQVTANNVDLTNITAIGVQMNATGDSAGSVTAGAGTYLTIT
ncbi:hypothetical protein IU451_29335 [Nocardia cyriacigeorgica]|uniref:hypothetical protein n=1 Tax=Nocardia cyriacigeorgica TaxID=135487 RepID=UPI001895077B|nr:hypothetical protein [Nocardia cyriacigeorgica]MBF6326605.1 hypothetical protein [Nocardia cyriacigeorgica]